MMAIRQIVHIDEEKCDGCGKCVPSCEEGAIQIIDEKAKLVADIYCDGLGACLGECPRDAISVIEREAVPFSEEAVEERLDKQKAPAKPAPRVGCPGSAVQNLNLNVLPPGMPVARPKNEVRSGSGPSPLSHWPIQLRLVPPNAPFLQGADLVLVADCVPFAFADFHRQLLDSRPVLIGCPKLDDGQAYVEKLSAVLSLNSLSSLTVVHMVVPCCTGLVSIAKAALEQSGVDLALKDVTVSIQGEILEPRD